MSKAKAKRQKKPFKHGNGFYKASKYYLLLAIEQNIDSIATYSPQIYFFLYFIYCGNAMS